MNQENISKSSFEESDRISRSALKIKNLSQLGFEQIDQNLQTVIHQIQIFDHTLKYAIENYKALDLGRILNEVLASNHSSPVFDYLIRILKRFTNLVRSSNLDSTINIDPILAFLRCIIRLCVFTLISNIFSEKQVMSNQYRQIFRSNSNQNDQLLQTLLGLYISFVVLEQRIQGNLPAYEGIWIVKERKRRL
jgi:hypothetical protein